MLRRRNMLLVSILLSLRFGSSLQLSECPTLQTHPPEDPALLLDQLQRRVELRKLALAEIKFQLNEDNILEELFSSFTFMCAYLFSTKDDV